MVTESVSPIGREEIDRAVEGLTVPRAFARTVAARGGAVALRWQDGDDGDGDGWAEWTWDDYAERACRLAGGFSDLGLAPGGRVALMMRNVPQFSPTDVAVLLCGATPFSIYNSSSPEQIRYVVDHAEATIAVVEHDYLERFLSVRDALSRLRHIVVVGPGPGGRADGVVRWDDLAGHDPVPLAEAAERAEPGDLATVIYTSGTTGPPKGVMLTHANVMWTAEGFRHLTRSPIEGKRFLSYLPMAHIAERMVSHYNGLYYGTEVTTCPDPTFLGGYLGRVKPHLFFGVPRVWEKIHAGIRAAVSGSGDPGERDRFDRAVEVGRRYHEARLSLTAAGGDIPDELEAAHREAQEGFALVRALVGLDECEVAFSGAAPIPNDVLTFFTAVGLPMSEIYGLSETTGPLTWDPYEVRPGTVGRVWPGCSVRLADDGEVLGRGGNIFSGYLKDPERTAEALDSEGWLHTGDVGKIDGDGYLTIVDRKKELIITAGGKNVSPANVENALKEIEPVGQAAVVGEGRPYLVAILVLDPDTAPVWAQRELGIEGMALAELAGDERVVEAVRRAVREVNRRFNRQEQVKRFELLGEEWLPDSDVLTPTMKLKRRGVNARYAATIEDLYAS